MTRVFPPGNELYPISDGWQTRHASYELISCILLYLLPLTSSIHDAMFVEPGFLSGTGMSLHFSYFSCICNGTGLVLERIRGHT